MTLERELNKVVDPMLERIRALETNERAEVAGGVRSVDFADLPAAGNQGLLLFVPNGRKMGEGVGAGTGVVVYDDGGASWRRMSDDTVVAA